MSENQASETVTLTSTVPVCCGSFQECGLTVEINQVDDVVTNKCELQFQNSHLIQGGKSIKEDILLLIMLALLV